MSDEPRFIRGIIIGVVIGAVMWGVVVAACWLFIEVLYRRGGLVT